MPGELRRSVWPIVAVLVLLPVLYVVSIGPAYCVVFGMFDGRQGAVEALDIIYGPVVWFANATGTAETLVDYVGWFTEDFL